jgi:hypothetical protein
MAAVSSFAARRDWGVTQVAQADGIPDLSGYSAFVSLFAGGETIPAR